jgi:hypothetical protein
VGQHIQLNAVCLQSHRKIYLTNSGFRVIVMLYSLWYHLAVIESSVSFPLNGIHRGPHANLPDMAVYLMRLKYSEDLLYLSQYCMMHLKG